jgi:DNA (cytosine-5)-methyltransferase 1
MMRILDLFCGAGGASAGLRQAFPEAEIVGIDIKPQPRYPFKFIQGDVLNHFDAASAHLCSFHFVWASPPCQRYSSGAGKWGTQANHPHLIPVVRERLIASEVPYVIENIPAAGKHLLHPVMLCGTQFGLGVFRHRLFEASFLVGEIAHARHTGSIGDGRYHTVTGHAGGSSKRDGWKNGGTADWRIAMGIDWMVGSELAEAIPPAYARYIGEQFKLIA